MIVRYTWRAVACGLLLALAACSSDDSKTDDSSGQQSAGGAAGAAGAGGDAGKHCVPVDAPGNSKKVGMYCTKGGGQCQDNKAPLASICAIDFDSNPDSDTTFCTRACVDNTSCGEDAVCIGDTPDSKTKGCVPLSCAPDWAKNGAGGAAGASGSSGSGGEAGSSGSAGAGGAPGGSAGAAGSG